MSQRTTDRRAVIAGGALIAGSGALASGALARPADGAAAASWTPTAEAKDAWLDKPGTRHRLVFDTSVAPAAESALYYADSFYEANKSDYGIAPEALGVVIILRHFSTPFAFNDAVWRKYGALIAKQLKLEGDKAERALKGNPLLTSPTPDKKDDSTVTLTSLHAKGARYAVCALATKGMAGIIAKQTGQSADAVEKELHAAVIPGGVFMASGIVALNRAQEHGYAFAYVGE